MKKRLVEFTNRDGKLLIHSISIPTEVDGINCPTTGDGVHSAWVDGDYQIPDEIEGKQRSLYYNDIAKSIDVEYTTLTFEDLSLENQIVLLYNSVSELYGLNLSRGLISESSVPEMLKQTAILYANKLNESK